MICTNKVILLGRICKDIDLKYLSNANNTAVAKFTVAVDRKFHKQGEEKQADFLNCTAFGKTGEFVSKYFTKGSKIALVGSIQTRSWDDAEGKKHYATDIMVDEVEFAESKKNDGNNSTPAASGANEFNPMEDPDGDLPFN